LGEIEPVKEQLESAIRSAQEKAKTAATETQATAPGTAPQTPGMNVIEFEQRFDAARAALNDLVAATHGLGPGTTIQHLDAWFTAADEAIGRATELNNYKAHSAMANRVSGFYEEVVNQIHLGLPAFEAKSTGVLGDPPGQRAFQAHVLRAKIQESLRTPQDEFRQKQQRLISENRPLQQPQRQQEQQSAYRPNAYQIAAQDAQRRAHQSPTYAGNDDTKRGSPQPKLPPERRSSPERRERWEHREKGFPPKAPDRPRRPHTPGPAPTEDALNIVAKASPNRELLVGKEASLNAKHQLVQHRLGDVETPNADPSTIASAKADRVPLQKTNLVLSSALTLAQVLPKLNSSDPETRHEARASMNEAVGMTAGSLGAPAIINRGIAPVTTFALRQIFHDASEHAVAGIAGSFTKGTHVTTQFGIGSVFLRSMTNAAAASHAQYQDLKARVAAAQGKASPAELAELQRQSDVAAFQTSLSGVMVGLAGTSMGIQTKSHSLRSRIAAGLLDTGVMALAAGSAALSERAQARLGSGLRHAVDWYDTGEKQVTDTWNGLNPNVQTAAKGVWNGGGWVVGKISQGVDWVGDKIWSGAEWTAQKGWDSLDSETRVTIRSKATRAWDKTTGWLSEQRQNVEESIFGPETKDPQPTNNPVLSNVNEKRASLTQDSTLGETRRTAARDTANRLSSQPPESGSMKVAV
jgi:hypothetical protein